MLKVFALICFSMFFELSAQSPYLFVDVPERYKSIDSVGLLTILAPIEKESEHDDYYVRLINSTSDTIKYWGYGPRSPWWRKQFMTSNNTWEEYNMGWFCGTGLRKNELRPGKSVSIPIGGGGPNMDIRIGIDYELNSNGDIYTVWTDIFTFLESSPEN